MDVVGVTWQFFLNFKRFAIFDERPISRYLTRILFLKNNSGLHSCNVNPAVDFAIFGPIYVFMRRGFFGDCDRRTQ